MLQYSSQFENHCLKLLSANKKTCSQLLPLNVKCVLMHRTAAILRTQLISALVLLFLNFLCFLNYFVLLRTKPVHMFMCVNLCMVLSIWASMSQQMYSGRPFSPLKSTRDITQQAISDLTAARKKPLGCSVKMARADGLQLCATVNQMTRL